MMDLMVTLWPSFPHFQSFAHDGRISGIRLNSAMMSTTELEKELEIVAATKVTSPLWFDIKGRQPRVIEAKRFDDHLEIVLNHKIDVITPVPVLFKAAADHALLVELKDDGQRLVFAPGAKYGPKNDVRPGESLHIRHPSLRIHEPLFTPLEIAKIEAVKAAGINDWFLSYVEKQSDVDQFLELVGKDANVILKIESKEGMKFVSNFVKRDNLTLCAARGDLYVELSHPHLIGSALRLIVNQDPEALVGSRILLSTITDAVPSCADFIELEWLSDVGYKHAMLCDELCLKENLLSRAVNAFNLWRG